MKAIYGQVLLMVLLAVYSFAHGDEECSTIGRHGCVQVATAEFNHSCGSKCKEVYTLPCWCSVQAVGLHPRLRGHVRRVAMGCQSWLEDHGQPLSTKTCKTPKVSLVQASRLKARMVTLADEADGEDSRMSHSLSYPTKVNLPESPWPGIGVNVGHASFTQNSGNIRVSQTIDASVHSGSGQFNVIIEPDHEVSIDGADVASISTKIHNGKASINSISIKSPSILWNSTEQAPDIAAKYEDGYLGTEVSTTRSGTYHGVTLVISDSLFVGTRQVDDYPDWEPNLHTLDWDPHLLDVRTANAIYAWTRSQVRADTQRLDTVLQQRLYIPRQVALPLAGIAVGYVAVEALGAVGAAFGL